MRIVTIYSICCLLLVTAPQISFGEQRVTPSPLISLIKEGKWTEIVKMEPSDAVSQFVLATAYGVTEQWNRMKNVAIRTSKYPNNSRIVLDFCNSLLAENPSNANVHFLAATHWLNERDYGKSIQEYKHAARLNSKFAPALYQIAGIYGKRGNVDMQLKYITKAIEADPELASSYWSMGGAYRKMKKYERAIQAFRKGEQVLLKREGGDGYLLGQIYYNWGWIYVNGPSPKNDLAVEILTKAVQADPERVEAWNELGIAYKRKKLYGKAIASYKKGLYFKPSDSEILFNLGVAYYRSNKLREARKTFQNLIDVDPNGSLVGNARQWLLQCQP